MRGNPARALARAWAIGIGLLAASGWVALSAPGVTPGRGAESASAQVSDGVVGRGPAGHGPGLLLAGISPSDGPDALLAVLSRYDPTPSPYLLRPPANPRLNQERDLLPQTRRALHAALDGLGVRWFVAQGINDDHLSAGTHMPDGRRASGGGYYSAVADISIAGLTTKVPRGRCGASQARAGKCLTQAQDRQFRRMLQALRSAGFAAWYRHFYDRRRGVWENEIHAIDPAAPYIKASLRRQMDDYLRGRDGLVRHTTRDAAGTIRPNRKAFCRRAALSAKIKGYKPFASDRVRYRSSTKSRYCGR